MMFKFFRPEPLIMKSILFSLVLVSANLLPAWSQSGSNLVDPSHIVQPTRWNPPLSSEELNKIMSCANYEKFGLLPTQSRETILLMHKDCCFSDGVDPVYIIIALAVGLVILIIAVSQMDVNKSKS